MLQIAKSKAVFVLVLSGIVLFFLISDGTDREDFKIHSLKNDRQQGQDFGHQNSPEPEIAEITSSSSKSKVSVGVESPEEVSSGLDLEKLFQEDSSALLEYFKENYSKQPDHDRLTHEERQALARVIAELSRRFPGDAVIAKAQLDPIAAETVDEFNEHLMQHFEKASELNPGDPDLVGVEMYLAVINGEPNLKENLMEYSRNYPEFIEGDLYLAGLYYKQGNLSKAKEAFFTAFIKNPTDPLLQNNKGFVLGWHSELGLLRYGKKIYTQKIQR